VNPQPVTDWSPLILAAAGAAITAAASYLRRQDRNDARTNHPNHERPTR
jgi:hypothetical protein